MRSWLALLLGFVTACDGTPVPVRDTSVPAQERQVARARTPERFPGARRVLEVEADLGLELDPGGARLEVVVVAKETGGPLPGVSFLLEPLLDRWGGPDLPWPQGDDRPETDSRGTALFEVMPGVAYELLVFGNGRSGGGKYGIESLRPGEQRQLRVALPTLPDGTFFGRVIDAETGEPVTAAEIQLEQHNVFCGVHRVGRLESDSQGRVELELRSWSPVRLRVEHPGYVAARVEPVSDTSRAEPYPLALFRPRSLEVLVQDGAGSPRAGLEVRLLSDVMSKATTAGNGVAYFQGLALPTISRVSIRRGELELHDQFVNLRDERGQTLTVTVPGCAAIEETVAAPGAIEGSVTNPEGGAVANAGLCLEPIDAWSDREFFTRNRDATSFQADARGGFRIDDLAPGIYRIGFPADWNGPVEIAPWAVSVRVAAGEATFVELVAHPPLHIEGLVVDPEGRPLPGVRVSASGVTTESEEDGRFWLGPVGPGVHGVVAEPHERSGFLTSQAIPAAGGADDVVLVLSRAGAIRGIVRGGCRAWLRLWPRGSGPNAAVGKRSWSDGSFEFLGLSPGVYQGRVETEDNRILILTGIALEPGEHARLEFEPQPAAILSVDFEGAEDDACYLVLEQQGIEIDHGYGRGGDWTWLRGAPGPAVLIQKEDEDAEGGLRIPISLIGGQENEVSLTVSL